MEVTKDNFSNLLPLIKESIDGCDFISIDCEFTGLGVDKNLRIDVMDSVESRYLKIAACCKTYLPVQVYFYFNFQVLRIFR